MIVERIANRFDEDIRRLVVAGGLSVYLNPKPQVAKTYAAITADFGSIDCLLEAEDPKDTLKVPDGVAHFLEHKLFEDEQGDISDRFASLGASCNARTGFTSTSYLFSCSSRVPENLDLLLDLVLRPYFRDQSVEREKGIIGQEIRMYDDDPEWRLYFNLLSALYEQHPVRIDIAGTVETIDKVTPEILYACHKKFYSPANMVLAVSGQMDPDALASQITKRFESVPIGERNRRKPVDEPRAARQSHIEDRMSVSRPRMQIGFKDGVQWETGHERLRREIVTQAALDCLFGSSSDFFNNLYDEGLIDDTFGAYYTAEESFGFSVIGGETDQPEALRDRLLEQIRKTHQEGLKEADFSRLKRRTFGRSLRAIDSMAANAHSLIGTHLADVEPYADLDTIEALTIRDVDEAFRRHTWEDALSVSVVHPAEPKPETQKS